MTNASCMVQFMNCKLPPIHDYVAEWDKKVFRIHRRMHAQSQLAPVLPHCNYRRNSSTLLSRLLSFYFEMRCAATIFVSFKIQSFIAFEKIDAIQRLHIVYSICDAAPPIGVTVVQSSQTESLLLLALPFAALQHA